MADGSSRITFQRTVPVWNSVLPQTESICRSGSEEQPVTGSCIPPSSVDAGGPVGRVVFQKFRSRSLRRF